MSRTRKTDLTAINVLKKQIKEKDDEIKQLKREIAEFNKEFKAEAKRSKKSKAAQVIELLTEINEAICPTCYKGTLTNTELGIKTLQTCNICGYKKTKKTNG